MEKVEQWLKKVFINGEWVDTVKGETFDTFRPTTGEVLCAVANGDADDVDKAVTAAKACLNSSGWGYASTGVQRAVVLRKLGKLFEENTAVIAKIDSIDMGKPMREAEADVGDAVAACNHFADLAEKQDKEQGEKIDVGDDNFQSEVRYEPIGVIGAITPWNYPFLMAVWKVIPAIAAGCCTVLKPSELAPCSCLLLAQMCHDAGVPPGGINVINGLGLTAGAAISNHPAFDKVAFTGSPATARLVMAAAALGPRAVSMELGGKSPLIICQDTSNLDAALDWVLTGFLWGSGQVCSATSRVYVHEALREVFMEKLITRVKAVTICDTQGEEALKDTEGAVPRMGPLVSRIQRDKVWGYIDGALSAGVTCAYGGRRELLDGLDINPNGYYVPPTIFVDPPADAKVYKEEIFGPVLCVRFFKTEEEAVAMANDTVYGLAAAVFSDDEAKCSAICNKLRAGIVWLNNCQPAFIQCPWGGVKQSGFGRELGRWGIEEFSSVKQVTSAKPGYAWGIF